MLRGGGKVKQLTMNNEQIAFYPNPTNGKLTIESKELPIENIEIYNIYGRNVDTLRATSLQDNTISIDISHLANGIYYLKIKEKVRKIIKINP